MFDKIVETLLQEAIARGEFDNLPNQGQPINLTGYFNTPAAWRVAASMLKNAGVRPPEVELLRQVADLKRQLAVCTDNSRQAEIRARLATCQINLDIALERIRQQRRK
jgi:hypothetical protein